MILAEFSKKNNDYKGFRVSGHAGYADSGQDIVCAAVTTAVSFAANLITDGFGCKAEAEAEENAIVCKVKKPDSSANTIISMLVEQLRQISEEFPETVHITISEV